MERLERAMPQVSHTTTVRARIVVLFAASSCLNHPLFLSSHPSLVLFLTHPILLLQPSMHHSRAMACFLAAPCCSGVVLGTPATPPKVEGRRRRRSDAAEAADRAAPQPDLCARGDLPRPRDEGEVREAAGWRVPEAADRPWIARDGGRAGLGPS